MKKNELNARYTLAHNIKKFRYKVKYSQEELAFRAGLHRTYLSSVERCKRNISIDSIEKIAVALEIPIDKLFEKK